MKEMRWEFTLRGVGGGLQGFFPMLFMLALFGGLTYWLHKSGNSVYLYTGIFSLLLILLFLYALLRYLFTKLYIGDRGFFHQTRPGNGRYYTYDEITEAWVSSGQDHSLPTCHYRTPQGRIIRFHFSPSREGEAIHALLLYINGEQEEEENAEA